MRITDPINNTLELGSDSYSDTIGIVFKTSKMLDNRPLLGLIIPKFMIGYQFNNGDKPNEKSVKLNTNKCINAEKNFLKTSVKVKNYILVRPYLNQNQSMPLYTQGDKVIVTIIDNDIKTMAFLPYSINRLGQRKVDKYVVSVPANPKENTALTEDNAYYIKMDSENKMIEISTSKNNGEICFQSITMDSNKGIVTITDNDKRKIIMDTTKDTIITETSGTKIEQVGDTINVTGNILNINMDSEINMETKTFKFKADTIKGEGQDVKLDYKTFKQTTQNGSWNIDKEEHKNISMGISSKTYHNDTPLIGLNGQVIFPNFTIGQVPNINIQVPPLNGMSGPPGAMVIQTDPAGLPLVKFPALSGALMGMCGLMDTLGGCAGLATPLVSGLLTQMPTTKILSS